MRLQRPLERLCSTGTRRRGRARGASDRSQPVRHHPKRRGKADPAITWSRNRDRIREISGHDIDSLETRSNVELAIRGWQPLSRHYATRADRPTRVRDASGEGKRDPHRVDGWDVGRVLIVGGIVLVAAGALVVLLSALGVGLGRLPGDLELRRGNLRVYVPIVSSILVSLVLTLLLNLLLR